MNEPSNIPLSSGSPNSNGIAGWVSTWITAVTKPGEQTFATLAEHPDAQLNSRAFLWVFLAGTVSALITGILQAILQLIGFAPQTPGLDELFGGNAGRGTLVSLGISICVSPVAGALAALFFAIWVGIIQWVAMMFKGTGTFSQLAYTVAAVLVPVSLVSSFITPLSSVPYVNICTGILSFVVGIYALVLEVMVVKAVNKFGWGQAIGSIGLPLLIPLCCIIIITVMTVLGARVDNTFNSISTGLP